MPIEIRELLIKVRIEEDVNPGTDTMELQRMKQDLLRACKKEIKKELNKRKQR